MLGVVLLFSCLVDQQLYEERKRELIDDDGDGFNDDQGDCDDSDPSVHPDSEDVCDGKDNDCDGHIDGDPPAWFLDADTDGYGDGERSLQDCDPPTGYVTDSSDCDDLDATVHPSVPEVCDGVDNDCDDAVDQADPGFEGDIPIWYRDDDSDGFGQTKDVRQSCVAPEGFANRSGDCDDGDAAINPDADEDWYTGGDQDCSGGSDFDADLDGYDVVTHGGGDCDDTDPAIHPGAFEWIDDVDSNCDSDPAMLGAAGSNAKYSGQAKEDYAGQSAFGCGDVNGDGWDDLFVGAMAHDGAAFDSGAAYIVFGTGTLKDMSLADADVKFDGLSGDDYVGQVMSRPGDVDHDGFSDLLVSAVGSDAHGADSGAVYLVYGATDLSSMLLSGADVILSGDGAGDGAGVGLAFVGDFNGDDYDDFVVGAFAADVGGVDSGAAYVYLGGVGAMMGGTLTETAAARIEGGHNGDSLGADVETVGDFNADGCDDIAVWASGCDASGTDSGCTYLFSGGVVGAMDIADADAAFLADPADSAGFRPAEVGDLDSDGYADLGERSPRADEIAPDAGAVYVFHGVAYPETRAAVDADARVLGELTMDWAGDSVAGVGDLDGDGNEDLLVGAPLADHSSTNGGAAYVLRGPFGGVRSVTDADAQITPEGASDRVGISVDGGSDWNGDGMPDLMVGAADADGVGAVYLIVGPEMR